jgi:hypothetical protein
MQMERKEKNKDRKPIVGEIKKEDTKKDRIQIERRKCKEWNADEKQRTDKE